jgi:predicted esterase
VVAPEGLSRFYLRGARGAVGASWMTREERESEIADTLGYLDALHRALVPRVGPAARVTVLGFSQGAAAAARWVGAGRETAGPAPERLVLWGGALPPDLDAEALARVAAHATWLVRGRDDAVHDAAALDRDRERLLALGREPVVIAFDGGHEIARGPLERLARG